MKKIGITLVELLVTLALAVVVFGGFMFLTFGNVRSSVTGMNRNTLLAGGQNAMTRLTEDLSGSNMTAIAVADCPLAETDPNYCLGRYITLKVPIVDNTDISGKIYTPSGLVKYGAVVNGVGQQNCFYEYKIVPFSSDECGTNTSVKNCLIRAILCDDTPHAYLPRNFFWNFDFVGTADAATNVVSKDIIATNIDSLTADKTADYTGYVIQLNMSKGGNAQAQGNSFSFQTQVSPHNTGDFVTVFSCGDNICAGGEGCSTCEADCGECHCDDGRCATGETCLTLDELSGCGECGRCCGNLKCEPQYGENCDTCAADCGSCCNDALGRNHTCESVGTQTETCVTCSQDCGACCPNGACDNGENFGTCPTDCTTCGNGSKDAGETSCNCPADFSETYCCGNNTCETAVGENTVNCTADCYCGNGTCETALGENITNCLEDCLSSSCGNGAGTCDPGENQCNCPSDCSQKPNDGCCSGTETHASNPTDCYCGNGTCEATENRTKCPADCSPYTINDG